MVIAKSDMVILVVSVSLLAAGIHRWQSNISLAHERRALASSPAVIQGGNSQRSDTNSLAAKPAPVSVAGTGIDTPVERNFGNAGQADTEQSSTRDTAVSSADTASPAITNNATGQPLYGTYVVKSGDTLSKIATDYGTSVDALRTINDISGSLITVGQNVRYPLPAN